MMHFYLRHKKMFLMVLAELFLSVVLRVERFITWELKMTKIAQCTLDSKDISEDKQLGKKEEQTKPVTSASSSLRLRGCAQNDKRTNKHLKHRKIS